MSKVIAVKDNTYNLIKAYSQKRNDSMSGTVERSIKFSVETDMMQGHNFDGHPELMALYNKIFVVNSANDKEVFKTKVMEYIDSIAI